MKKYLLFILSGLALQPTFAKGNKNQNNLAGNDMSQYILRKQATSNNAQKTTAVNWRMIAYSYMNEGAILDTAHYYYSNGRGSDLTTPDTYGDGFMAAQYSDKQSVKSDSSKVWSDWSGNEELVLVNFKSYEYDASNRPIKLRQAYLNSSYTSDITHEITYDAHGRRLTNVQSDTTGGSAYIPKFKHYFTYDANGKLINDSIASVVINSEMARVEYVHDANGNLLSMTNYQFMTPSLVKTYSREYTYDANNRLIKDLYTSYDWTTGAPQYGFYDTLEYVGSNPSPSAKSSYYTGGTPSTWIASNRMDFHFNTAGAIDTYYIQEWNDQLSTWDTTERDIYYYHPNGLINYHHGFNFVGNGIFEPTPYDKQSYYYEEYFPTSVSNVVSTSSEIIVYPNPVQDRLRMSTQQKGAGTLSIYNMQGQEVLNQSFEQLNGVDINISALPAANYIINVKDAAGKINHHQQITKQ